MCSKTYEVREACCRPATAAQDTEGQKRNKDTRSQDSNKTMFINKNKEIGFVFIKSSGQGEEPGQDRRQGRLVGQHELGGWQTGWESELWMSWCHGKGDRRMTDWAGQWILDELAPE